MTSDDDNCDDCVTFGDGGSIPHFDGHWDRTAEGNYVLAGFVGAGGVDAIVFHRGGRWLAISNRLVPGQGRLLRGSYPSPGHAIDALVEYESWGQSSEWFWPVHRDAYLWVSGGQWRASRPREGRPGFWRRGLDGVVLSVRQARSGSWYAIVDGEMLPGWHPSAGDAMAAADRAPVPARLCGT